MSESTNAFRRSLSLTTEKSSRMLLASEVSVILRSSEGQLRVTQKRKNGDSYCVNKFNRARLSRVNRQRIYSVPLWTSVPPIYSGKYCARGTCKNETFLSISEQMSRDFHRTSWSLAPNSAASVRNSMTDVCKNQPELTTAPKIARDSSSRVYDQLVTIYHK